MISVKGIVTIFPRKKFLISGSAGHEYRTGKKTVNAAKKKINATSHKYWFFCGGGP
jgi:hypothetical protein